MQIDQNLSASSAAISNEIQEKSLNALISLDYVSSTNQGSANTFVYIDEESGAEQVLVTNNIVGEELGLDGVTDTVRVSFQSMDSRLKNINDSIAESLEQLDADITKNIQQVHVEEQNLLTENLSQTSIMAEDFTDVLNDLENSLLEIVSFGSDGSVLSGGGIDNFIDLLGGSFSNINMDKDIFDLIKDGDTIYGGSEDSESMFDENGNVIMKVNEENNTFIIEDRRSIEDILKGRDSVDPNDNEADKLFYSYDAMIEDSYSGIVDMFGGSEENPSPQTRLLGFQFYESSKKNAEHDLRKKTTHANHDPTQDKLPIDISPTNSAYLVTAMGQTLMDKVNTEREKVNALDESWINQHLSFGTSLDGNTQAELQTQLAEDLDNIFESLLNDEALITAYQNYQEAKALLNAAENQIQDLNPEDQNAELNPEDENLELNPEDENLELNPEDQDLSEGGDDQNLILRENAKNALLEYSNLLTAKFAPESNLSTQIRESFDKLKLDNDSELGVLEELKNFTDDLDALAGEVSNTFGNSTDSDGIEDKSLRELLLLMFVFSIFAESEWDAQIEASLYS